jgi:hypothetical protein
MCKGNISPKKLSTDIIDSDEELAEGDLLDGEEVGIIFEKIFPYNRLSQMQFLFFSNTAEFTRTNSRSATKCGS